MAAAGRSEMVRIGSRSLLSAATHCPDQMDLALFYVEVSSDAALRLKGYLSSHPDKQSNSPCFVRS